MKAETQRLELIPLTLKQLTLWKNNVVLFEQSLDCVYEGEPMQGFFLDYLNAQIDAISSDESNYPYYAFWMLIRKADRVAIGTAAFKGLPNENGEIEIGYGLGKEFEHHGYMTEAVAKLCEWGLSQEKVKHIIAQTDLDGEASKRVLERNGFTQYRSIDSSWWRL